MHDWGLIGLYITVILGFCTVIGVLVTVMNIRFTGINQRFASVDQRFDSMNQRFDDMRDLWRAELKRVEEVLDARLKHIEEEHRR